MQQLLRALSPILLNLMMINIIGLISSSCVEQQADRAKLRPPEVDPNTSIKRLFVDYVASHPVDSEMHGVRFLALTDGEVYTLLRRGECLKHDPGIRKDYLTCAPENYAIFRSKLVDAKNCTNAASDGLLGDLLEIESTDKFLSMPIRNLEPISGLDVERKERLGRAGHIYHYQACVHYKKVEAIPDDTLTWTSYGKEVSDTGYIRKKETRGFVNYRSVFGAPINGQEYVKIPTEYCYSTALTLRQELSRSPEDDKREIRFQCFENRLHLYVRLISLRSQ